MEHCILAQVERPGQPVFQRPPLGQTRNRRMDSSYRTSEHRSANRSTGSRYWPQWIERSSWPASRVAAARSRQIVAPTLYPSVVGAGVTVGCVCALPRIPQQRGRAPRTARANPFGKFPDISFCTQEHPLHIFPSVDAAHAPACRPGYWPDPVTTVRRGCAGVPASTASHRRKPGPSKSADTSSQHVFFSGSVSSHRCNPPHPNPQSHLRYPA